MKLVKMLVLALGLVTLATASSFAAVAFSTTSTVNMMNVDAQTGLIGSVLYTPMTVGGTVNAGEIISVNVLPSNAPISYLTDITVSMTGTVATSTTSTAIFAETWGSAISGNAPNGKNWVRVGTANFAAYGDTMTATTAGTTISGASVQVTQNSVVLSFGTSVSFAAIDFIKIEGIRVDVTSIAVGGGSMQVSLTNTIGQATTDSPLLTVATFVPENQIFTLTTVTGAANTAGNAGLKFYSNGTPFNTNNVPINTAGPQNLVTVTFKELFPNAFETKNVTTASVFQYTRVKIALGNLPAGLAVTGITLGGSSGTAYTNGQYQTFSMTTYTWSVPAATLNPLEIGIVSQNPNSLDTMQVGITFGLASGFSGFPVTATPITITATLDQPVGAGIVLPYSTNVAPNANLNWWPTELKYKAPATANATGSIPVTFVPVTSNLLTQYSSVMRPASGTVQIYDTGIAISNLSGSNASTTNINTYATTGTIQVTLYPMDPIATPGPYTFNTSALTDPNLKKGLDSAGALPAKGTWRVLLSQLLSAAGFPATTDFYGFIRFQCNFQEASGITFMGDGAFQHAAVGYVMISDVPTSYNGLSFNTTTGAVTGTVVDPRF